MKCKTEGTTIQFTFDGLDAVTFDATKATPEMRLHAEMDRWVNRLRDNAAIPRKGENDTVVTITEEMRREAVLEMVTYYEGGATMWNRKAGAVKSLNPTWFAIAQKRGVAYEIVAAEKAAADIAELKAM